MPQKGWMQQHVQDIYVKRAKKEGYPSRAAFKLLELQQKDALIKKGMTLVDLGAAPGGWSIVASRLVGSQGKLVALDRLAMKDIPGVLFVQGDFTEDATLTALQKSLGQAKVDGVLSDMAPNLMGIKSADQACAMGLVEYVLDFAEHTLTEGGFLVVKVFQGPGIDSFISICRQVFTHVKLRKPPASRSASREFYVVATNKRSSKII